VTTVHSQPIAVDLFCGLGGWTEGLLAEGYYVVGFDIERHVYGIERYPGQLVLQDVRTVHGRQFRNAALIVGSSPCQEFSYRAMPWKRAKALGPPVLGMELFEAQFRIQREASQAAGRHIPMVVENVKGAQPWVGRSRWCFGSFHLWGDVPALMPMAIGRKNGGGSWFNVAHNTASGHGKNPVHELSGVKFSQSGDAWFDGKPRDKMLGQLGPAAYGSGTQARKRASAMIAKIPLALSSHIARVYHPGQASV
jgi:hypothetical protein